ncbi:glycoside hydrolase family 13 protein [Leucobacter sp. Z1108]|uniref:glycoside hydrolase family 13 protein n=1 Tax=Leucobacter sp. Z1108 TaxID=3439066 RepID=UPI003F3C461F
MSDPLPPRPPARSPAHAAAATDEWWRSAVIYQVYPRSFADSDGDGVGDLPGITSRLTYLRELGADAVWISPFFVSPQADGGYDVADYCDVDPVFGTLDDADALIARAHELGLRVLVDLVPNHTSDEHPWFRAALAAAPGSPERDWYIFRDPDPADPERLPNNWPSVFGGPAWSKTPDGQWYLHLFDSGQPDLNWENPRVRAAFLNILRFWLDRGVDGFRVDVAHGMMKAPGLPDFAHTAEDLQAGVIPTHAAPFWDQDRVHEIYRSWRQLLESYPGERAMVAEAWVQPHDRLARYVRPDEHHQAFNFALLSSAWSAAALRTSITDSFRANDSVGAPTTWVLSNHDVIRHATRLGWVGDEATPQLGTRVPTPHPELGLRRARAATTLLLALPGGAYLYQGEELGLPEVLELDAHVRQDPTFRRTEGAVLGRDGCRVPIPWERHAPAFGFSQSGRSWLPQPTGFGELAMDQQEGVSGSTLELYRTLLATRRSLALGTGALVFVELGEHLLAFDVETRRGVIRVVLNLGEADWPIPAHMQILVSSSPTVTDRLPTDCAVWLADRSG